MATQDPRTVVKFTSRVWAEEVAIADAGDIAAAFDKAYEFNGGRIFFNPTPYRPLNSEPADNPPGA